MGNNCAKSIKIFQLPFSLYLAKLYPLCRLFSPRKTITTHIYITGPFNEPLRIMRISDILVDVKDFAKETLRIYQNNFTHDLSSQHIYSFSDTVFRL